MQIDTGGYMQDTMQEEARVNTIRRGSCKRSVEFLIFSP